ncbi:MAG TPA: nitroreductase family protein, partial [Bacteroidales bacterium]|nr:nitroreductase family protein [Bacteroidales bacterium]
MSHLIDSSTCTRCRLCVTICPSGILAINEAGEIISRPDRTDICVTCGHCMAVCETRSIRVNGLEYGKELAPLQENTVDYTTFRNFLLTRRSVRHFRDQEVPLDLLQRIADTFALAPYGMSPENVSIAIVTGRDRIREALPAISNMYLQLGKMLGIAPMRWLMRRMMTAQDADTIFRLIYPHVKKGLYDYSKEDDISREAPAMLLIHGPKNAGEHTTDGMIGTTYAFLAAHALGLGATVIGLIGPGINRNKKLKELYGIPPENEVIQTIIVGYPK